MIGEKEKKHILMVNASDTRVLHIDLALKLEHICNNTISKSIKQITRRNHHIKINFQYIY